MATFSDLSNEIHNLIGVNLRQDDLINLGSLKSCYFNAWMDLRWKTVVLDLEEDRWNFLVCRMSNRIKNLSITYTSQTSNFVELISLLKFPFPSLFFFKSEGFEDDQFSTTLLQTIMSSPMAATLRRLYLSAHPRTLEFPVESGNFKCLEVLSLEVTRSGVPSDNESVAIAPFVRSVSATLKALHINNRGTRVSLASLFVALSADPGQLRRLTTISLEVDKLDIPAFHDFLFPYYRNLEQLGLAICNDDGFMEAWLDTVRNGRITFPSLRACKICAPTTPEGLSLLTTHMEAISSTLTRLELLEPLQSEAFKQLFGTFSESAPSNLQMLAVETDYLTITLLDLFATKIPLLETLKLRVNQVKASDDRGYDPGVSFPTQDVLHSWKLRYLVIKFLYRQPSALHEELCHLLADAVPSLEEIRSKGFSFAEDQEENRPQPCDHFDYSRGEFI